MTTHNHMPSPQRRKILAGTISLGLLLLLGAGALTQSLLTEQERTHYPAPGQMVSVGTHRLHLHCQGSGQPVVVQESGLSGWLQDWAAVEDLRTLLRNAGVQGPMVIVGHSLGGLLAQLLAQKYPDEMAGLVLVDALHQDMAATMDPQTHARYNRHMNLLTGSAALLASLRLTRLAGMPASVVLSKLPAAEQAAAKGMAMQSKNYRALRNEYLGCQPHPWASAARTIVSSRSHPKCIRPGLASSLRTRCRPNRPDPIGRCVPRQPNRRVYSNRRAS